jgi:hypothetical protein
MFDLEKAFDKVWHQGLLYKLKIIDTPRTLFNWILDFLTNRTFYVRYNEDSSTIYRIKAGVPQGCIISPILFSIYISDISKKLSKTHGLFADDISLWKANRNIQNLEKDLQKEVNNVESYCHEWCLSINIAKTTYTVFTTAGKRKSYEKKYSMNLEINNKKIILDHNNTEISIQKRINIIRILKSKHWSSSKEFLLNFYKTYIRPLIDYANFPFIVASQSTRDKLQIKQNKILRICLNSDILDSTARIHEKAQMETLEIRQHELTNKYLHKTIIMQKN